MVLVTDVEKLRGGKVLVKLDNGSVYQLLRSAYLERPLSPGDEIDADEYERWVLLHQYRSALDKAVAMLAARICSKGEIRGKLHHVGYSDQTIEMVLLKLEKNNLLNDQEFASAWAAYRSGKRYGPGKIRQELRTKGIASEDTDIVLNQIPEEILFENAVSLARKSLRSTKETEDPRKIRQRVTAMLVRRGYSWDLSRQAFELAFQETDHDID